METFEENEAYTEGMAGRPSEMPTKTAQVTPAGSEVRDL